MTLTEDLARFASEIQYDDVPPKVMHSVKNALIDCVGCGVAGTNTCMSKIASSWVKRNGGREESTLLVEKWKGPSSAVAFANTISMNAIDFEPFGPESHVSSVAIPSAIAVGESLRASGKEFLAALAAGIEVAGRVGVALKRYDKNKYKNWPVLGHTHAVFGAAVAAGRLLHLDTTQMANAFGIAGYSATLPTLKRMFTHHPTPMTKYDNLGLIAQAGVQAAYLAKEGFTGDQSVLDGEDGFWKVSGYPECDWRVLVPPSNDSWYSLELWFKPYPVTSYTVTALDAIVAIMDDEKIMPQDIKEITIATTSPLFPSGMNRNIESSLDAWLSWPYVVSALVNGVRPFKNWQSERIYKDKTILGFMERVKVENLDPTTLIGEKTMSEGWNPARVVIKTKDNQFERTVLYLRQLNDQDLESKFIENVEDILGEKQSSTLLTVCKSAENYGVSDLSQKLTIS